MKVTNITIQRKSGYGHYLLTGMVNGQIVTKPTTNSECFDWLNDDSNEEKHQEAIEYAKNALINQYEQY